MTFTAKAVLKAYFGQTTEETIAPSLLNSINGSISDIVDGNGDTVDEDWTVELLKTAIESNGSYEGDATGMGSYSGQFHGSSTAVENVVPMPSSTSGTFDAHFSNGHVLGAFGASRKAE